MKKAVLKKVVFIAALMTALLLGSVVCFAGLYGDFTYTESAEGITITAYSGTETDVVIPGEINGKKVIKLDGSGGVLFENCNEIKSVKIPDSVTVIGPSSFSGCKIMTSIELPSGLKEIGDSAFTECNKLQSIEIPSGVTGIGSEAFIFCENLKEIRIPSSVKSIGNDAFSSCKRLQTLKLESGLESIGNSAFCYCESLKRVDIPDSVETLGDNVFSLCGALETLTVDSKNTVYDSRKDCNAIIRSKDDRLIKGCKNTKIPDDIKAIENEAFMGCSGMTGITIPSGVLEIGDFAFSSCGDLEEITIPSSVETVGNSVLTECGFLTSIKVADGNKNYDSREDCNAIIQKKDDILIAGCSTTKIPSDVKVIAGNAFFGCSGLTEIEIPSSVEGIEGQAFADCTALKSIDIPAGLYTIGEEAFSGCSALTAITVDPANTVYDSRGDCNAIIDKDTNTLIQGCMNTVIPADVETIGAYAFRYCKKLETIKIPLGVKTIESNAFDGCSGLKELEIPEGVTTIGNYAFIDCNALESISIPSSVATMGDDILQYCNSLLKVVNNSDREIFLDGEGWKDSDTGKEITVIKNGTAVRDKAVIEVTGVKLDPVELTLAVGEEKQLSATVIPEKADNQTVSWKSSDPGTASVDATGKVRGVSAGNAEITVTTEDGGFTDTCRVTVSENGTGKNEDPGKNDPEKKDGKDSTVSGNSNDKKDADSLFHKNDGSSAEAGSVSSGNAAWVFDPEKSDTVIVVKKLDISKRLEALTKTEGYDGSAKHRYSVEEKSIAKVDKKGILKPKKRGTIHISLEQKASGGSWAKLGEPLVLYIQQPEMKKKDEQTLSAGTTLNAFDYLSHTTYRPKWISTKPGVASIDENTGVITVNGKGTAKIIAEYGEGKNGSGKKYATKLKIKVQ